MLNDQLLGRTHENLFVPGENPADFYALLKSLVEGYEPQSSHEQALVEAPSARPRGARTEEELASSLGAALDPAPVLRSFIEDAAIARWHLWRRERASNAHEAALYEKEPDPAHWLRADFKDLDIVQRFKRAAEISCRRAFATLEALRKENIRTQRWELSYDLQKQRLALAERKYNDIAPKVQAQAKLAAIRAERSAQAELDEAKRFACNGQKRPSVIQKVKVAVVNGVAKTIRIPSNQDVMAELAERALHIFFPPQQIVREFEFTHSIPREYDWAAEDGDRSPADITQIISLADFVKIAAIEKEHCLGDPPDLS